MKLGIASEEDYQLASVAAARGLSELGRRGFTASELDWIANPEGKGSAIRRGARKQFLDCLKGRGTIAHVSSFTDTMYEYGTGTYVWFDANDRVSDWSIY
ncbi:MAG TPA: hypothetical protein VNQ78_09810 [Paracoccus sp. (in: a-proteobacteria)]|uniref:hypothetical protein n=1 Tax=Paracoccus sp. TaxID=267 RepID=UPI002B8B534A|nr:hypothetical protein [Paracoccus sp. (in: a-proteobacteria)]HWL56953.1 hypothetical protein [Paracoccus sp. (in: a-proteobacteria)]